MSVRLCLCGTGPLAGPLSIPKWYMGEYGAAVEKGKTEGLGENLCQCHFVHNTYHMDWPGRELGPPPWEADDLCMARPQSFWIHTSETRKCTSPYTSLLPNTYLIFPSYRLTELRGVVVRTPASYPRGAGFVSRLRWGLLWFCSVPPSKLG
jgi:hypothetical protein